MKRLILLSFVILAVSSCGNDHHIYRTLKDVGTYISDSPDSAYNVLSGIDKKRISRYRTLAKYSLLMSIALDKKYIDVTEDTLIRPAVLWYERHGSDKDRMLAYYYHGRVYQNAEDYNQAIIAFSNAEKYAKICEDDFYLGMIYRGMTRIYNAAYNHAEEIRYSQLAYEYFLKIDNPSYAQYAMLDIALAYHNSRDFNKCITISEDICKIAIENNNTNLLSGALRAKMSALINKKNPDSRKAADIFFYMLDSLDYQPSIKDYGLLANAYSLSNRNAEAMNIVKELKDQVRNEDKISSSLIYNIEYKVAKNVGEYKKALTLFENVTFIQDSILSKTLSQSVINTQKDYFKRQAEYDAERLHMKNTIILLIGIASAITLASISYFWLLVQESKRQGTGKRARDLQAH